MVVLKEWSSPPSNLITVLWGPNYPGTRVSALQRLPDEIVPGLLKPGGRTVRYEVITECVCIST